MRWSESSVYIGIILMLFVAIILRYLCSFGYGLFCYNGPESSSSLQNEILSTTDVVNPSRNETIQVTVTNEYYGSDIEISEQRSIPVAHMV